MIKHVNIPARHKGMIDNIFDIFGDRHQMMKLAEECNELAQSIVKYAAHADTMPDDYMDDPKIMSKHMKFFHHMFEEMADVLVLIAQFDSHYSNLISENMEKKLARLARLVKQKQQEEK